jgi:hypothetical protein
MCCSGCRASSTRAAAVKYPRAARAALAGVREPPAGRQWSSDACTKRVWRRERRSATSSAGRPIRRLGGG